MADEFEKKGVAASVEGEREESVEFFTQALLHAPSEPRLYVYRAAEKIQLGRFTDAIVDTDKAIELDPTFWKAYYRKGIALQKLKEHSKAKAAFEAGLAINPEYPKFKTLIAVCDSRINGATASVNDAPSVAADHPTTGADDSSTVTPPPVPSTSSSTTSSVAPAPAAPAVQAPVQPKFRHSYYQGTGYVVVTIYAKGVSKEQVKVDFGEQLLSVVITVGDSEPYALQIRLFGKIAVPQCKVVISNTKIDITLAKADSIQWKQLEYSSQALLPPVAEVKPVKAQYPSSSRKGTKDWDKLESEVKKEEKDEKLEGDAALNKLFREIYSGADEDTRRAMNKSYVESNGTVLSTNWKEVGSKKVVSSPPQGMEAKKWEA